MPTGKPFTDLQSGSDGCVSAASLLPAITLNRIVLLGKCSLTLLTFARSCRRHGIAPYLVEVTDTAPQWRTFSSALAGGIAISPDSLLWDSGMESVLKFARSVHAEALVPDPSIDVRRVIGQRHVLEPAVRVLAPPAEALAMEDDKMRQLGLAQDCGFALLPTWPLARRSDASKVPDSAFPLCVRPSDVRVRPRFKALHLRDRASLQALLDRTHFFGSTIVAQPFIDAPNLKVHGVRSIAGEFLSEQAFWTSRKFKNVTLSLIPAHLPDTVRKACRKFVEECALVGNYQFDLIGRDDTEVYYLEINPRAGGTTDKVVWLGFEEPMLTLAAYGYRAPHEPQPRRPAAGRTVVNKRTVIRHMVAAMKGELTPLDYPGGGMLHHLGLSARELLTAKDSIFDPHDLKGSVWYHCRAPRS